MADDGGGGGGGVVEVVPGTAGRIMKLSDQNVCPDVACKLF